MNTSPNVAPATPGITIQKFLTAIGAAGVPAIFLPFTFDLSPFATAGQYNMSLWRLSWPFFLPVLITTALIRWLFLKKQSQKEIIAGYIVGGAMLAVTFSGYIKNYSWPDSLRTQIAFMAPIMILAFGVFIVLKNRRKLIPGPAAAIIVMQVAYLANCLLCLISFIDSWQIAAYLSLATAMAYLAQIILLPGEGIQTNR